MSNQPNSQVSPEELEDAINNGKYSTVSTPEPPAPAPETKSEESTKYNEGFDIANPVELLVLVNEDIREGRVKLHKWQIQFLIDFATGNRSKDDPFQAVVRACNGSGKDKYIIAPCVVWLGMRYPKVREIVTSSSGDQLDNQTDAYINQLCTDVNAFFGFEVWKINYRYYECLVTGSQMKLYATDEPGKAEGYHPLIDGGKMGIFLSEGKSIPDDIFAAIDRCTGYTHRIDVSTPGLPSGVFFDTVTSSVRREEIKSVLDVPHDQYIQYHITAHDCPHISASEIARMKRRMKEYTYSSAVDAEFTTNEELVVVPYGVVNYAVHQVEQKFGWHKEAHNNAGLDLSAGGDETVLSVRNGNKLIKVIPFKLGNTEDTIDLLDELFREHKLTHPDALIYADCGGLGEPMLNSLKRRGWKNIRFVDNRNTPKQPRVYYNRGAETWFEFGKLCENREIILIDDDKTIRQLSSRLYKMTENNEIQLESKLKMKTKGKKSPDRADSVVLCFWNYKSKVLEDELPEDKRPFKLPEPEVTKATFTLKQWAQQDNNPFRGIFRTPKPKDFSHVQKDLDRWNEQHKTVVKIESE